MERRHASRHLDRDLDPRADRRPLDQVVQPGHLGRRHVDGRAALGQRAGRRRRLRGGRHAGAELKERRRRARSSSRLRLFSASGARAPSVRNASVAISTTPAKAEHAYARRSRPLEPGAGRARVLADGLPRRRRGLVQPDLDVDGAGATGRRHRPVRAARARRRRRRLRLALRRARQLAVQHRLRR